MATIGDRVSRVAFKLGNRQDLLVPIDGGSGPSRLDLWLTDAYISLGFGVTFPESEVSMNFLTVAGSSQYARPDDVRAIKSLTGYKSDGTVLTIETKDIGYLRRYQNEQVMNNPPKSTPAIWAEFGSYLYFSPVPNDAYSIFVDYWQKPIVDQTSQASIESTNLQLPDDWLEVLDYEATMRGHAELQEPDKSMALQQLLYGATDASGRYSPGLIQNLMNRRQASTPYKDWGLQPKVNAIRPYGGKS